ncbi:hypothetical protein BaRGS_00019516 [Batillaria attramentaria]|uniref:Major facilitator superfamily (MFS) profile domain-containing protein n=1 Tax=Batillaria attramentaria TaxID=370345 RepID=A0ABD0KQC7_9CAEN
MAPGKVNVDDIQLELGSGRFQLLAFIVLGLIYSRGAWHVFGIMFLAGDPGHKCALPSQAEEMAPNASGFPSHSDTISHNGYHKDEDRTGSHMLNRTGEDQMVTPEIDLGSNMLYAFQGDSVMVSRANWTANTCDVSYITANGSSVRLASECPYGWSYGSQFEATVLSEWDLVCSQNFLVELSITVFMVGATVGAMLILPLADRFGRKSVMLACLFCQAAVGSATAFVDNYILFTVLRFVVGMLNIGVGLSSFVLVTETFPAKQRTVVSIAFQIFWAVGVMTVAGFGHLVRNWRHLELLLSLPNLLALPCYWLLPESLPWLVSRNRLIDAENAISKIAKVNGKKDINARALLSSHTVSDDSSAASLVSNNSQETFKMGETVNTPQGKCTQDSGLCQEGSASLSEQTGTEKTPENENPGMNEARKEKPENRQMSQLQLVVELFSNGRMRLYCCVMFFLFFVNSLGYFGISFSAPVLHGNPFVNLCILGAVEIPADIICILVSERMGRRYPNAVFLLLCGIANIVALFTPDHLVFLKLAFVMLGKFAITASYSTVYLYSAEIFPTAVRNQAMGMSSVFENIGSISAPFIVHAAKTLPHLPLVIFGVLSMAGATVTLLLPETHNRPLPQTVNEITEWGYERNTNNEL